MCLCAYMYFLVSATLGDTCYFSSPGHTEVQINYVYTQTLAISLPNKNKVLWTENKVFQWTEIH